MSSSQRASRRATLASSVNGRRSTIMRRATKQSIPQMIELASVGSKYMRTGDTFDEMAMDQKKIPRTWVNFNWFSLKEMDEYELKCAKHFRDLGTTLEEVQKRIRSASTFSGKDCEVWRLMAEWRDVTPQMFVTCLSTLGQDTQEYLGLLSLEMRARDWDTGDKTHLYTSLSHMRREVGGSFRVWPAEWKPEELGSTESRMHHPWGKMWDRESFDLLLRPERTEHTVHWTSAARIVDPGNTLDQIHILKALDNCSHGVYNTAVGRAVQNSAYSKVKHHHRFSMMTHILQIFCLERLRISSQAFDQPDKRVLVLWSALVLKDLIIDQMIPIYVSLALYGRHAFRMFLIRKLNMFSFVVTVVMGVVIGVALFPRFDKWLFNMLLDSECPQQCLHQHMPSLFAFAIFFKWIELIISFLSLRGPGVGVFITPVFYAVRHKESIYFLIVNFVLVVACWHSYISFPLIDRDDYSGFGPNSLLRIFRLVMLADFDLWELEGVDPQLFPDQSIDERPTDYHWGVAIFFLITVLLGVVMMNVYIALLGNIYNEAKFHRYSLHMELRVQISFKMLLFRHWCENPCNLRGRIGRTASVLHGDGEDGNVGNLDLDRSDMSMGGANEPLRSLDVSKGCWIVYDRAAVMDDEDMEALHEQVQSLHQKIDILMQQGDTRGRLSTSSTVSDGELLRFSIPTADGATFQPRRSDAVAVDGATFHPRRSVQ